MKIDLFCVILFEFQARHVALVIGQAFSVAYKEFLRANGISEDALEEAEYTHVLNAQSVPQTEVESLADRNKSKKVSMCSDFRCITVIGTKCLLQLHTH